MTVTPPLHDRYLEGQAEKVLPFIGMQNSRMSEPSELICGALAAALSWLAWDALVHLDIEVGWSTALATVTDIIA